ncbi:fructose PTS transporter subunit IIA [Paenibacillus sediminis]|uniref:PTS system fructose-specific IIA component n=1 Tax=Paenibacillus sediminis TaxID=664909 RepID=A0ABS4H470_9BACL|nr:fructose PTS transporter subunit IIA [Paenibacillus sediminis]MBP1937337.1 PTS system fructose-specific IIA component [Paenibacillus sediminis]
MNIHELLNHGTIMLPLDVDTREDAIRQMAASLERSGSITHLDAYIEAVLRREQQSSTGIGFGVAIPHGKSAGVSKASLAFARFNKSIDWDSLDGSPATMAFMIAVPEANVGNEHLQILVALSRKLIHEDFRQQLTDAQTPDEIIEILAKNI